MIDLRARLADALKRHQFWHANHSSVGSAAHCLCGLRPRDQSEWADHVVADVLLPLHGIAIVELPEAQKRGLWTDFDGASIYDRNPGEIARPTSEWWITPELARKHAAALLAAANAAESLLGDV